MKLLRTLARVVCGYLVAVLVAGIVTVAFIVTPSELLATPQGLVTERMTSTAILGLVAATHSAMFGGLTLMAPLTIALGEWQRIRSFLYYALIGMAIALVGFFVQYWSEATGQPTIVNPYALVAMLTAGFAGGLAYWLIAGRRAGGYSPRRSFTRHYRRAGRNEAATGRDSVVSVSTKPRAHPTSESVVPAEPVAEDDDEEVIEAEAEAEAVDSEGERRNKAD